MSGVKEEVAGKFGFIVPCSGFIAKEKTMHRSAERGFTLIEIMIVVAIIALLAAIAIPNVLRGRTTANESAAIGNLRALLSSVEMYRSVYNVYPFPSATVANWATFMYNPVPAFGPQPFNHVMDGTQCPPAAASSCTQGFRYTYTNSTGNAYTILAIPDAVGTTGTRAFLTNESGLIRHCADTQGNMTAANLAGENTIDTQPNLCNNSTAT